MNGGFGSGGMGNTTNDKRQASATKRRPNGAPPMVAGRNTQAAGWAKGQLPVAMQQQQREQAHN